MASNNNDYETDAQIETSSSNDIRSSADSSAPTSNRNLKDTKNEYRYKKYVEFMPYPLNQENIDILIICAPNDEHRASVLKKDLEKLRENLRIVIMGGESMQPNILNDHYSRSMFYFLFVTEEFKAHDTAPFKAHVFLNESLHEEEKKWRTIPVYPNSIKDKDHLGDITLRNLDHLEYYDINKNPDKVSSAIDALFKRFVRQISIKERNLHLDRKTYFDEHEQELIDLESFYSLKDTSLNKQPNADTKSLFVNEHHNPATDNKIESTLCDTLRKQKLDQHDDDGESYSKDDVAVTPATMRFPVKEHQINYGTENPVDNDTEVDGSPTYPNNNWFDKLPDSFKKSEITEVAASRLATCFGKNWEDLMFKLDHSLAVIEIQMQSCGNNVHRAITELLIKWHLRLSSLATYEAFMINLNAVSGVSVDNVELKKIIMSEFDTSPASTEIKAVEQSSTS